MTASLTAALLLASPPPRATQAQSDHSLLGIVRADGGIVPFAIYDGRDWWNRWPWAGESDKDIKSLPLPASIDAVPADWLPPGTKLPSVWKVLGNSGRLASVRLDRPFRPTQFDLATTIVLRSNYRVSEADRKNQYDATAVGVAVAGAGELGRFTTPSARESRRILDALRERLRTLEETELARWQKERRESPGASLEPITLSRAFRGPARASSYPFGLRMARPFGGKTHYYLTGEKLYSMGLTSLPSCKVNVSFAGVVVTASDGTLLSERISVGAYAGYCGDPAASMDPLAVLHLKDRVLWIVRFSVEDGYDYGLFDPVADDTIQLKGLWQLRER